MKQDTSKPTTPKRGVKPKGGATKPSGVSGQVNSSTNHSKYLLPSEKLITSRNKKDTSLMRKTVDVGSLKTELKREILQQKSGT